MNPAAPVTNMVAAASRAIPAVWRTSAGAATHNTRTEPVRRPHTTGDKMKVPMKRGVAKSFGAQLKALRVTAGFTQEELATIAGLSVHAVSALERGERRRPHGDTVRALSAALDLTGATRATFVETAEGTRVVFVPLAAIGNAGPVAAAIAEALGLSDVASIDLPRRARTACADHPTVLLLDNFEQVLDAAPLVAGLLESVASIRVVVTSRAPLGVRGEREYGVGPLRLEIGANAMSPADLARAPAVRLFVEDARHRRHLVTTVGERPPFGSAHGGASG